MIIIYDQREYYHILLQLSRAFINSFYFYLLELSDRIDTMSDGFRKWLAEELRVKDYSQSAFAEAIGVTQSFVSKVLSGDKSPSLDFLVKTAVALDISPLVVFTKAGIFPAPSDVDLEFGSLTDTASVLSLGNPALTELTDLARALPPDKLEELIRFARFLRRE